MNVRPIIVAMLAVAVVAGVALYWLQVHAFYYDVSAEEAGPPQFGGAALPAQDVANYRAIDSDSSPIRFRACYEIGGVPDGAQPYPAAEPLVAPRWFDCFDARAIGAALQAGEATAYLDRRDIVWGIDRVVAVYPDGRAYAWHQINPCGEVVFDGDPAPADCPPLPEGES